MNYLEEQKKIVEELRRSSEKNNSTISCVPMSENFINDPKRCLTLLSYLPADLQNNITPLIEKLRSIEPWHYFYPKESFHLTIQNVRTVNDPPLFSATDEKQANLAFESTLKNKKPLEFKPSGLLKLRTSISIICFAEESYKSFVKEMQESLKQFGVGDNKQYISKDVFFGNITICRFSKEPGNNLKAVIESMEEAQLGTLTVSNLSLVVTNSICETKHTREINSYKLEL